LSPFEDEKMLWWVGLALVASVAAVVTVLSLLKRREREREARAVSVPVAGSEQWAGKRVCVVVNPIGGAGHGKRVFQRVLKPMLTNAGLVVDLIGAPPP
jgi:hypothetical protein